MWVQWWLFPLSPAESRRGLPKGPSHWCWEPGSIIGPLSWATAQQPGSTGRGRPMNSLTHLSPGSGGRRLLPQLRWQEDLSVYARLDPYLVQSWFLEDNEKSWGGRNYGLQLWNDYEMFLESQWELTSLGQLECTWKALSGMLLGSEGRHSIDSQCYDNFCF